MRKILTFGKVAYSGKQKRNLVDVEIALRYKEHDKPVFTASADIWNSPHTDIYMGGQCLDDIWSDFKHEIENPGLFKKILGLWKRNHLNNMHAGCVHQELVGLPPKYWSVDGICQYCGYTYGSEWKYKAIPFKDLYEIKKLLDMPLNSEEQAIAQYKGLESVNI